MINEDTEVGCVTPVKTLLLEAEDLIIKLMSKVLHARIYADDGGYSASCEAVHAYTQGEDLDQAVQNLKEAISLALEGEDLSQFRLEPGFSISITMEVPSSILA